MSRRCGASFGRASRLGPVILSLCLACKLLRLQAFSLSGLRPFRQPSFYACPRFRRPLHLGERCQNAGNAIVMGCGKGLEGVSTDPDADAATSDRRALADSRARFAAIAKSMGYSKGGSTASQEATNTDPDAAAASSDGGAAADSKAMGYSAGGSTASLEGVSTDPGADAASSDRRALADSRARFAAVAKAMGYSKGREVANPDADASTASSKSGTSHPFSGVVEEVAAVGGSESGDSSQSPEILPPTARAAAFDAVMRAATGLAPLNQDPGGADAVSGRPSAADTLAASVKRLMFEAQGRVGEGDYQKAAEHLETAIGILVATNSEPLDIAVLRRQLGTVYFAQDRFEEAMQEYRRAHRIYKEKELMETGQGAELLLDMAIASAGLVNDTADGTQSFYFAGIQAMNTRQDPQHRLGFLGKAKVKEIMGRTAMKVENFKAAASHLDEARLQLLASGHGSSSADALLLKELAACRIKLRHFHEAARRLGQASEVYQGIGATYDAVETWWSETVLRFRAWLQDGIEIIDTRQKQEDELDERWRG